ncbi:competence/damage-inducible protein A [Oceanobacillus piezotolerans]|uniref:Putative competence-damage inducible protein n=1 Tax=Oceanobacillus piezotolerans TaxID=2448030 RepID=A0A498DCB5_9BACI|nr:competence/damage-inducible protein A [Oceanobacillus piezotolerans]RLL45383.1 competence/damage-inducible protein A [Oceanobacillus piezotolerans]
MTKSFSAEIIAVGTELLLGQIANTNAKWLSEKLALLGIHVYTHVVVGDNLERVEQAFRQAERRSDIVLVTGGLGPTDDDLTREAFQRISHLEMEEYSPAMKKIESYFERSKTKMTPNNRKQARVFKGSHVLNNQAGMAPGMIVHYNEKIWIFLPGVPREMKRLATDGVFPYLQQQTGKKDKIQSLVLKFIGIGESALEDAIQDLIQAQSNPTIAPLAQNDGVVIRLTVKADSDERANTLLKAAKEKILERVGIYYYGENDDTLEQQVIQLLKEKQLTIAAAESLTGGMFASKLISVSGASNVVQGGIVSYHANVKQKVLGVSKETIEKEGTVSKACASEMAAKVREKLDADIGISFTGVAGPNEEEGNPVGTVYIALHTISGKKQVFHYEFMGDRSTIRHRATLKGLEILFQYLKTV